MIHLASGTKYAAAAEVPGSSTSTFFALGEPTLITPTRLYFAGVPGALKPGIQVTFSAADADAAQASAATTTTIEQLSPLFTLNTIPRPRFSPEGRVAGRLGSACSGSAGPAM